MNQKIFAYGGFALIAVLLVGSIVFFSSGGSVAGNIVAEKSSVGLTVASPKIGPCSDTDGGRVYGTKGTVTTSGTAGANTATDSCNLEAKKLVEQYCAGNQVAYEEVSCELGQYCKDGACVLLDCMDSDDGADLFTKGTLTYGYDTYTDACKSGFIITEYYCNGGKKWSENLQCPPSYACTEGICIPPPCTDTDGGKVAGVQGKTSRGTEKHIDVCSGENNVIDYFCDSSGDIQSESLICGLEETCREGACAKK